MPPPTPRGLLTGDEIDYVEKTSATNITANTVGGANTVVSSNAVIYDGATRICIEFYIPRIDVVGSTTPHIYLALFEDGTQTGVVIDITNPASTPYSMSQSITRFFTPSAGSHTYSIRGYHNTGSFTSVAQAGSGGSSSGNLMPAYLRITRA